MNKMKIAGLLGSALLVCGTQAQADISWTFTSPTGESSILGNTISKTSGTVTATAQAWANTNNGITVAQGPRSPKARNDITATSLYTLETAYLNVYTGGLGVKNLDASARAAAMATKMMAPARNTPRTTTSVMTRSCSNLTAPLI